MSISYEIDYSEVEQLEEKIKRIPENVENIINSYLHKEGAQRTIDHITSRMPMSKYRKRHAKTSKWSRVEKFNLGFTVKPKGGAANKPNSFGYLVFPNEGRGPRNPIEHRFMERGLEGSIPEILDDMNQLLDEELRRELE
jgi:hypothetical protein